MPTESPIHPELTERDLEQVRGLIEDVRAQERAAQLLFAAGTWLNAFSSFKRLRRRYGFPHEKSGVFAYGAVLSDLKTTGKCLVALHEQGSFDLAQFAINREDFEACVRELSCDDVLLEMGLLHDDLSDVEAVLGKA
jgi:hypothetical protein